MVKFPDSADKYALVDLEGDCWITNEPATPDQTKLDLLKDVRDKLERIEDYIKQQEEDTPKEAEGSENG